MKAVIFDMDGVVVDSERYWKPVEEHRIFPEATGSDDLNAAEITGMNVRSVYAHLTEHVGTEVTEAEFVDLYDRRATEVYREQVSLMNGFADVLATIRDRGLQVALTSPSPHRWIDLVLDRFDLQEAFETVVSADDLDEASKPASDVYRHTADTLDVEPERCITVEDSKHGVDAAKEAGTYCIGYRATANRDQNLSRADVIVEGSAALRTQIERRS